MYFNSQLKIKIENIAFYDLFFVISNFCNHQKRKAYVNNTMIMVLGNQDKENYYLQWTFRWISLISTWVEGLEFDST